MSDTVEKGPELEAYLRKNKLRSEYQLTRSQPEQRYYYFENPEKRRQGIVDAFDMILQPGGEVSVARDIDRNFDLKEIKVKEFGPGFHAAAFLKRYERYNYIDFNCFKIWKDAGQELARFDLAYPGYPSDQFVRLIISFQLAGAEWVHIKAPKNSSNLEMVDPNTGQYREDYRYNQTFVTGPNQTAEVSNHGNNKLSFSLLDTKNMVRYHMDMPQELPTDYLMQVAEKEGPEGLAFYKTLPISVDRTEFIPKKF